MNMTETRNAGQGVLIAGFPVGALVIGAQLDHSEWQGGAGIEHPA